MAKLLGSQEPRLYNIPDGDTARGDAAVGFARELGMTLYPWQEDLLRDMCRTVRVEDEDSGETQTRWSAREVVVVVPRQNGKGEVLVARELAGIYLFNERIIFHSAHRMDTVEDAQKRLWEVIERNPDLMNWWVDGMDPDFDPSTAAHKYPKIKTGNGKEQISFPNGSLIYFRTRSNGTGRGLTINYLILDECYDLPSSVWRAMGKTTSAVPNSQKIFISSPVDISDPNHMHGAIFSAKRWAGIDGAEKILFKEWSMRDGGDPFAYESWVESNPSLVKSGFGQQLDDMQVEAEGAKNSEDLLAGFLVESLGVGNWFPRDGESRGDFVPLVDLDEWGSKMADPPVTPGATGLGVDVTPEGEHAALVAAIRTGEQFYLTLNPLSGFDRGELVGAVKRTLDRNPDNPPLALALDPSGQCSTLVQPLEKEGIYPEELNGARVSKAWELFDRLWKEGRILHDGDPRWMDAWSIAEERSKQGRYRALERFVGDVSVLVAASFALAVLVEFSEVEAVAEVEKKKFVGKARAVHAPRRAAVMQF